MRIRDLRWTLQICEILLSDEPACSLPLIFFILAQSFFNCMQISAAVRAEKSNLDSEQLKV